jgi:hypothetical protein
MNPIKRGAPFFGAEMIPLEPDPGYAGVGKFLLHIPLLRVFFIWKDKLLSDKSFRCDGKPFAVSKVGFRSSKIS